MKLKFEEKQYETQMNIELACHSDLARNIFSPGQVLEGVLGFDVALYSCNKKFWKFFYKDVNYFMHDLYKYGMDMGSMSKYHRVFEEIYNSMPDIRYNLFVQYKRPKYLKKSTASEYWKWERPYYRFNIVKHQQKLLENLSSKIGNSGLVIYASPAFITQNEFWENVNNNTLVENSTFCKVDELKNHYKYTYIEGGRYGVAFSEPEEIEKINLKNELRLLREKSHANDNIENNAQYILNLSTTIHRTVIESEYAQYYKDRFESIENLRSLDSNNNFTLALLKIKTFEEVTGINIMYG